MGETKFYLISSGECPNQGPQCRHFQSKQGNLFQAEIVRLRIHQEVRVCRNCHTQIKAESS
jgi:hypothetical protein